MGLGVPNIGNMGFVFGQGTPSPAPIMLVTPEGSARVVADGQTLIVAESHAARLTAFHSRWHLPGCRRGGVDRFPQYKGCASCAGCSVS